MDEGGGVTGEEGRQEEDGKELRRRTGRN